MPVHKSLKIFTDFKGLDTLSSDYTRGAQYASTINNAKYNKQGSILKRNGHTQIFSSEKYGFGLHKFLNIDLDDGSMAEELLSLSPFGVYKNIIEVLPLASRYFQLTKTTLADFQCRLSGFTASEDGTQDNLFWKGQLNALKGYHVKLTYNPVNVGNEMVLRTSTLYGWTVCWFFEQIYDPDTSAWLTYGSLAFNTLAEKLVDSFDGWSTSMTKTRAVVIDSGSPSTDYYVSEEIKNATADAATVGEFSPHHSSISASYNAKANIAVNPWVEDVTQTYDIPYMYLNKEPTSIYTKETIEVWFGNTLPPKPKQISPFIFEKPGSTYFFRLALDLTLMPEYFQLLTTHTSTDISITRNRKHDNYIRKTGEIIYLYFNGMRWIIDEVYLNNLPHVFCIVSTSGGSWGDSDLDNKYSKLYIDGDEITGVVISYPGQFPTESIYYDTNGLFLGADLVKFDDTLNDATGTSMDVLIQGYYYQDYNTLMGGRMFDFAIYQTALSETHIDAISDKIENSLLVKTYTTDSINKYLLCHYTCGRGSNIGATQFDKIHPIKGSDPTIALDLNLNVIYDMSGQTVSDERYAYVQNDSLNAYVLPKSATDSYILSKQYLDNEGAIADVESNPELSYVSKIYNNIANFSFENPTIINLNDVVYIAGASGKKLLKYDGHSLYQAGISSTWDVPLLHKNYEEPFIESAPNVRVSTNNYMFQGYDEVTDTWGTKAAYRYRFRKVHVDAKGHLNKGTTSSPHLEDQDAGIYRVDAARGGTYEYIRSVILLGTGEERASIIIGGDNSIGEVWTAQHPSSKIHYTPTGIVNTEPMDEDEINSDTIVNNIHCEAFIGDRVYCMNRNVKNTGACKEGVPGHITEALCTSTAGKAEHGGTWFKTYGAWEYDYQEFIVTNKTGPFEMSALSESTWDGENMKYYKLTLEAAVEGEPDFKYNDDSAQWEFTTTEFTQSNLNADRWISTSNHRIQIYRTKNIWYDDGGSCADYEENALGYTTQGSCELPANKVGDDGEGGGGSETDNVWTAGRDKYEPKAEYYLVDEIPYPANTYKSLSFEDEVGSDEIDIDHVSATKTSRGFLYIDEYHDKALEYRALYIQDDKTPQTPPDCKYATAYGIQLILSGNIEKPNAVYYSDFDAPENFPERNSFLVDAAVTGIGAINRDLYIFQEDTVQVLNGDLIKDNFRVTTLAKGHKIGTVSHHSIVEVKGSLFFLTEKGVFSATPGQANIKEVSALISPEFNASLYNFKKATAFNWISENLYILYLPFHKEGVVLEELSNGRILAFDYERGAWLPWSGIYAGGGVVEYEDNIYFAGIVEKGVATKAGFKGSLSMFEDNQLWDETLADDEDDPNVKITIPFKYGTHWESLGDPTSFKKFLRVKLFADDASNKVYDQTLSIDIHKNFKFNDLDPWGKVTSLSIPNIVTFKTTKLPTGKVNSINLIFKEETEGGNVNIKGYELEAVANHQVGEIRE